MLRILVRFFFDVAAVVTALVVGCCGSVEAIAVARDRCRSPLQSGVGPFQFRVLARLHFASRADADGEAAFDVSSPTIPVNEL